MKSHFDDLMELVDKSKSNYDEWLRKHDSFSLEDLWRDMEQKLDMTGEIENQLNAIQEKYPKSDDSDRATILAAEFLNKFWIERLLSHAALVFSMKLANKMAEVISKTKKKETLSDSVKEAIVEQVRIEMSRYKKEQNSKRRKVVKNTKMPHTSR